jgi:type IV pilus assembly protein PilE
MEKLQKGFTLIELLVSVAILAILAVVAIPNYKAYIYRSHRAEGLAALQSIQLSQEKYRASNTTYGTLADVWGNTATTENGYYTLAITGVSGSAYTATATGVGDQANDSSSGTSCATLSLSVNNATVTKTPADCWR